MIPRERVRENLICCGTAMEEEKAADLHLVFGGTSVAKMERQEEVEEEEERER